MWKTVLFDLDGTLTDPKEGITKSVAHALAHYGIAAEPDELVCFIGPPLIDSFRDFYGFEREKGLEAVKYYREYFTTRGIFENAVYDNIPALLKALKDSGMCVALATSKPEPFAIQILEHFGISEYFDHVCGAPLDESINSTKGTVIATAIEKCGNKDFSEIIMVGDRKHDILGAHENRIECIGVLYGYGSRNELTEAGADYITETVESLKTLLTMQNGGTI